MIGSVSARLLLAATMLAALGAARAEGPSRDAMVGAARPAPDVPLADHRAIYRVTLLKATGTKSPTSARGKVS